MLLSICQPSYHLEKSQLQLTRPVIQAAATAAPRELLRCVEPTSRGLELDRAVSGSEKFPMLPSTKFSV